MQTIRKRSLKETPIIRREIIKAYQEVSKRLGSQFSPDYSDLPKLSRLDVHDNFVLQSVAKFGGPARSNELSGDQTLVDGPDVSSQGLEIYENRLRSKLEPECNGQTVAIHIASGDHEVAHSSGNAMRAIRKRYPAGPVLLHTIGRVLDSGLAARMSGQRIVGRQQ